MTKIWRGLLLVLMLGAAAAAPLHAQPLYTDGGVSDLFADPGRARNVGDTIIIKVRESLTTAQIDDMRNDRTLSSLGTGNTTTTNNSKSPFSFINNIFSSIGIGLGRKSDERTTRQDRIDINIAAQVVQVLPNGYLVVEAQRDIKINQDKLNVAISGTVRPRDVNRDGEVESPKVAEFQMFVKRTTHRGIIDNLFRILF